MSQPIFPGIEPIQFQGPDSQNPLAFRFYDKNRMVRGKRMEEQLRVAVCYWHTFCGNGSDVFGSGDLRPPLAGRRRRFRAGQAEGAAAFEFFQKLGNPYYCFHDRDVAPEGKSLAESNDILDRMVEVLAAHQQRTGVKLLWGTANLFSNPRFMSRRGHQPRSRSLRLRRRAGEEGARRHPKLGGENYVLWGGREGYETLLNTDMKRELDQLGRFMNLVVEYKHKIGFKGPLLIEPKPREPTKHQYDYDVGNVYAFLQHYGLDRRLQGQHREQPRHAGRPHLRARSRLRRGQRHLRQHRHEPRRPLRWAGTPTSSPTMSARWRWCCATSWPLADSRPAGSTSTPRCAGRASTWPTCSTPTSAAWTSSPARCWSPTRCVEDGKLQGAIDARYKGWTEGLGKDILDRKLTLEQISERALKQKLDPKPRSGQQELLENLVNRYVVASPSRKLSTMRSAPGSEQSRRRRIVRAS
jgi:xylose isomerase